MPTNKTTRIIIDTNLWISFLIKNEYERITRSIVAGEITLIFSDELLNEFLAVTERPKFQKYFSRFDVVNLLHTIDGYAEFVHVRSLINICRDKRDNFLLSLAVDGDADYLLSGDNDLLVLDTLGKTKIIAIKDFFDIL